MHELSAPAWTADLLNAQQTRLRQWLEVVSALARFRLASVELFDGGFGFSFQDSARTRAWLAKFALQHFFRVDGYELDDRGTYLLLNAGGRRQSPTQGRVRGALCGWDDLPKGAAHVRSHLEEEQGSTATCVQQILAVLQIPEAALNSVEVPSYSVMKWGHLVRLDRDKAQAAIAYLCVEEPLSPSAPLLINLAANMPAVFAWSQSATEPLRIALCGHWATDLAFREAARWIKSQAPRNRNKTTHLTP